MFSLSCLTAFTHRRARSSIHVAAYLPALTAHMLAERQEEGGRGIPMDNSTSTTPRSC